MSSSPDSGPPARTARSLWITGPGQAEIREETLAAPGPGEVLVQAAWSAVSRGTELLVFRGLVPETEQARMRAPHQAGELPFPVKYGYQSVGRVLQGPANLVGRFVFCLYPHQTQYVVPEKDVFLIPETVPPARAVLAGNCETALNALWDGEIGAGDHVSVVGAGTVGALVAFLASRHPGVDVELVDVDPHKAAVASALGVGFASPDTARKDADLVVHASGSPWGLSLCLSLAGFEATVIELSWYGDRPVELSLGGPFHSRRIGIRSSQVGHLPAERRARWTHRRRMELALRLLQDSRVEALFGGSSAISALPGLMTRWAAGEPSGCHRIDYGAASG